MRQRNPSNPNARRIASNSFWYGLELALGVVAVFATTIPMARIIGPERLGYYAYIAWLTTVSAAVGNLGIAAAARKYMAESLGRGDGATARAIYRRSFWLQSLCVAVIAIASFGLMWGFSRPDYWHISFWLVLSMVPSMTSAVASQANAAGERMRVNAISSLLGGLINIVSVGLSLYFGWDLHGIAIGVFLYRSFDCLFRVISVHRWLGQYPVIPLEPSWNSRLSNFSAHSMVTVLLNIVVWDRSEIFFLRHFASSAAQISFYSIVFNMTDKLQLLPNALGTGIGLRLQAQYGSDPKSLPLTAATSLRYVFCSAVPFLLGFAALSPSLIPALYGPLYLPSIPVLGVAACFATVRCFMLPGWNLLQATENHAFLSRWMGLCAILNVVLDVLLISRYEAVGGAVANGLVQVVSIAGIWVFAIRRLGVKPTIGALTRILIAGCVMGASVLAIQQLLAGWFGIAAGVFVGVLVYFTMIRLLHVFDSEDRQRILQVGSRFPAASSIWWNRFVHFLIPIQAA